MYSQQEKLTIKNKISSAILHSKNLLEDLIMQPTHSNLQIILDLRSK